MHFVIGEQPFYRLEDALLHSAITCIKGIGEQRAKAFKRLGVNTVIELLYFMPRDYLDYSQLSMVDSLACGERCALRLRVLNEPKNVFVSGRMQMLVLSAEDETGQIQVVWYNQPYRKSLLRKGCKYIFCGQVDNNRINRLINPIVCSELPGILPIYPLTKGLTQGRIRAAVKSAADAYLEELNESLPNSIIEKYELMDLRQAIYALHFPQTFGKLEVSRKRLAFEDLFAYFLAVNAFKEKRKSQKGISFKIHETIEEFEKKLPFNLTKAQRRVLLELEADLKGFVPMNRLIQGDVGSGKTVLALYALKVAASSGYQAAFMAPTEILAKQHFDSIKNILGTEACLLSGSMKKSERDAAYSYIETGRVKIIVGTHALIQPGLKFLNLGLVITDEQHRFGVRQRAQLVSKSNTVPDVLIMSATPIPRTLSMLLYGDLELSMLDELPPGRLPIKTHIISKNKRAAMYEFIYQQLLKDMQAYVVCPLIVYSERFNVKNAIEVFNELVDRFPNLSIGLLHGSMSTYDKAAIAASFRRGEIKMLVSTTVVEVGLDVPSATIMVVENAEQFGLAQLHQLRGRVGRGKAQSFCFLVCEEGSKTQNERLQIMVQTSDGFEIAERDLELRGPGEFLGTRQHGLSELSATSYASMSVLLEAKTAAAEFINSCSADEIKRFNARLKKFYNFEIAKN